MPGFCRAEAIGGSPPQYYVRNGGNDAADGLSDATAWATIGKVNGATLGAGDIVNFKRGSRFEDASLTRALVGASGNPLTLRAYGSDLHVYTLSGWTAAGTAWWARLRYLPSSVIADGVTQTMVNSLAEVQATAGRWYFDRVDGRLYLRTHIDTDPATITVEANVLRPPIIGGGPELTVWTAAGAAWWATLAVTPTYVVQDDWRYLTSVGSQGAVVAGTYFYDSGTSRLYLRTFDDDDPDLHLIEAQVRDYGALPSACQHVVVEDIEFRACALDGWLGPAGTTNLTMRWVLGRANRRYGIYFGFSDNPAAPINGVIAEDLVTEHNGATGLIWGIYHSGGITIARALSAFNCHKPDIDFTAGIRTAPADFSGDVTVEDSIVAYNGTIGTPPSDGGYGIWMDSTGINTVTRGNEVKGNLLFGINIEQVVGTNLTNGCEVSLNRVHKNLGGGLTIRTGSNYAKAWNNTLYDNGGNNLHFVNAQSNVEARNNIAVRGPSFPTARNLAIRNGAETGLTLSHNCFGAEASGFIDWEAAILNTYDAAETEYGGTLASIEASPQLVDPENGDFRLSTTSPCIEAGVDVGLPYTGAAPTVGAEEETVEVPGASLISVTEWQGDQTTNQQVHNVAYAVPSGCNKLAVAAGDDQNRSPIASITWTASGQGAQNLTARRQEKEGAGTSAEIWDLNSPNIGAGNIVITYTGVCRGGGAFVALQNASASAPAVNGQHAPNVQNPPELTAAPAGSAVYLSYIFEAQNRTIALDTGAGTLHFTGQNGNATGGHACASRTGSGTLGLEFSFSASSVRYAQVIAAYS